MLGKDKIFDVLPDTGCSRTSTPYLTDFVLGSTRSLESSIEISGANGDINVSQIGQVNWEFI